MFEKELYKKAIENSKIPVVITDFNGGILDVSLGFVKLSGIKKDVLIGMDVRKILGIPELKEKFEMIQKIKGGQFKIEIEKFSLEGMDFYILTLIKLSTGESSLSRMDFLKDVLESAFDLENLQKYLRLNIEYFVNIFGADGVIVLKKVTKPQEGFVMLHISKNASNSFQIKQFVRSSIPEPSIGSVTVIKQIGSSWPSFASIIYKAGFKTAYLIPVSRKRGKVEYMVALLYRKTRELPPDEINTLAFLSFTLSIITKLNNLKQEAMKYSYRDKISRTYTQNMMKEFIKLQFNQAKRYDFKFTLLQTTIMNYTDIKKLSGELGADLIMEKIAYLLTKNLRKSDIIGRYTENSFLIILPFTDQESAQSVLSRVFETLKNTKFLPGKEIKFTISLAEFNRDDENYLEILKRLKENRTVV